MGSNVAKGNYYRLRTKKWLQSLGYLVENLERQQRVVKKNELGEDSVFFLKFDIWGADLIARNEEHVLFVQVKTNEGDVARGIKELNKGPWPGSVDRWVVYWPKRRKFKVGPEIIEVGEEKDKESK
jgi:hypothetical protein